MYLVNLDTLYPPRDAVRLQWAKSTVDQADILSQIIKLEKHKIVEKPNAAY